MLTGKNYIKKLYDLIDEVQLSTEDFVQKDYSFFGYIAVVTKSVSRDETVLNIRVHYQATIVLNMAINLRSRWVDVASIVRLIDNICY